jgi:hypothetical protein
MPALRLPRAATPAALVVTLAAAVAPAGAQVFQLEMTGDLDARSAIVSGGAATPLGTPSPFTLTALFDTRSPNLVAPIPVPGFRAYTPISAQLTLGARTYDLQGFGAATPLGISVSIFDPAQPFNPGSYAVGIIQDPLADGSGFVAAFRGASPAFTLGATGVVPATFTEYYGVGVSSGVCLVGAPGPNCQQFAVTPIPMTWNGQAFGLRLANYEEDFAPGRTAWTARIVEAPAVVPEPTTVALVGAGVLALGAATARRRRQAGI